MPATITQTAGQTGQINCMLSYSTPSQNYGLMTRARSVSHGFEVIATESHARQYRAFYPHQRALSPFTVELELMGYPELKTVMDWLRGYLNNLINAYQNAVGVSVPAHDFYQVGVPVGGLIDMDRTGSMVFRPSVVFESVRDPLDTKVFTTSGPNSSVASVELGITANDDAGKFFYPSSPGSNDPNATGTSLYDSAAYQPTSDDLLGVEHTGGAMKGPYSFR